MGFWANLTGRPVPAVDGPRVAVARTYTTAETRDEPTNAAAWQLDAWRVWEKLGEIHYPTTQIARLCSRLDWNVSDGVDDEGDPKPSDYDLEGAFENPGLSETTRALGLNIVVAGECWLTKTGDEWTVFSVNEPNLSSALEKVDIKIRVWTPDPRDSSKADSGVRAALGPAHELLALQNLALAQIHSRAASAGILLRPNTRTKLVDDNGDPVDFTELLHQTMTAAIRDTASTAAVVPIDLELPIDEIPFWTHLQFTRPYDDRIDTRMERVIRRIALALDIWPELLLGVADINHWGSWFLSEDTWRSSTAPLAEQLAQAMEVAVLEADDKTVTIMPDPAVLLARRSSVRDALNAAWIGGVGLKYIREVIGAEEKDKPTPEELDIIRLMAGQRRSETRAGIIAGEEDEITPSADTGDSDAVLGAIGDLEDMLGVDLVRIDDQLKAWLEGVADTTIENVRSQVGIRLRRALRSDPRSREIDAVPNSQAAAFIGEATFDLLDVDNIVTAGIKPTVERWELRLVDATRRLSELTGPIGVTDSDWAYARRRSVEVLQTMLKDHIINTLTEKSSPFLDLREVITAAGLD